LEAFEYAATRTGVRYGAPQGLHDDAVCALALARQHFRTGPWYRHDVIVTSFGVWNTGPWSRDGTVTPFGVPKGRSS